MQPRRNFCTLPTVPVSQKQLLRQLRVAFTAAELELLQAHKAFAQALDRCSDSAQDVQKLIEMGGGLLAERDRPKSKLRDAKRRP